MIWHYGNPYNKKFYISPKSLIIATKCTALLALNKSLSLLRRFSTELKLLGLTLLSSKYTLISD